MTRLLSTLVVVLLCVGIAFAGTGVENQPLKIDREEDLVIPAPGTAPAAPRMMKTAALTWTLVDSCPNVYGQGNSNSYNYAYDEDLDAHVIIHRGMSVAQGGYSPASGYCWYNLSTDGGATWPRFGDLNGGVTTGLRYPSCFIANPTGGSDINSAIFVMAAPNLENAGGFGNMTYAVDFPLGGGAAVAFNDVGDGALGTGFSIWQDGANTVWTVDAGGDGTPTLDGALWRWWTADFVTVASDVPAGLNFTGKIPSNTWGVVGGDYGAGKSYIGYQGRFEGTATEAWPNFGYTTSTDGGASWGAWSHPASIYDLLGGTNLTVDRVPTGIGSAFVVDKDGYPHYFCVVTDTTADTYQLVEVYQSGSGWAASVVKDGLNPDCELYFGGLDQTSWGVRAATDAAGEVIAVAWVDAATSAADDSLADVWFAARSVTGTWSVAENLTMSPDLPELILHAPPRLKTNGDGSYTMFFNVSTDRDAPTEPSDVGIIYIWASAHTFNVTTDVRELPGVPETYTLEQNYPNPFNPTTNIVYSVPQSTFVTLKVYDVLGSEVATLVNEVQNAGNYTVDFNAADLANGAYFYRLTAGSFTDVKKMVLMK